MTRHFWNLVQEKRWRKKTIWSENDSASMIFLAYKYLCYIKPQYYSSLQYYYYDIICGNQNNKNRRRSRKRKLNFYLRDALELLI